MTSESKKLAATLVSIYDIKSQVNAQSDKIVITLPRIAQTLPFLGVKLFMSFKNIPTVITVSQIK